MSHEQGQARVDFERALVKGFLVDMAAFIGRSSSELLSFDEVKAKLRAHEQFYRGIQTVPISKIVGSLNRYQDFDHQFLPIQTHTRERWVRIDAARLRDEELPPIELYKVGEAYFVRDGNHRVSVARERGQEFIDAEVIEYPIRVPLDQTVDAHALLLKAEYAGFLERTELDRVRPVQHIEFSLLGGYKRLEDHIAVHRYYLGQARHQEISWPDAAASWHDNVYMPAVSIIRERSVLSRFPGRSEADLYLWIMEHRYFLSERFGRDVGADAAIRSFVSRFGRQGFWRRLLRPLAAARKLWRERLKPGGARNDGKGAKS